MDLTLGAMYLGAERCRFRVWAPLHDKVEVHLLTPHDRCIELARQPWGYHEAVVAAGPGTRYFYRLGGGPERPDPASRFQPLGVHGPSEVSAPLERAPRWADVPLHDYVIYEIHVGTFTPAGTFDAVIDRLDALRELGVTALELMPVAQFPGARNWGYDGVFPFAVQNSYGGLPGLVRLIDACHARGLAVVLDVVYNHLGPEGNYFADYGPYLSRRHRTDWGEALNYDGPHSDAVRRYFIENALYWFGLGVDALRLDATNMIQDLSARHFLEELAETVHDEARGRRWYLIAEDLANDPRVIRPRARFGHGLDAQWCDDFHHALHALLTGERQGYYADFGALEHLARTYRQGYHLTGQYCHYRQRHFGREPLETRADQFVVYSQNHDQVGNRLMGERLSRLAGFEALKLAAAALLLGPNIPLLFMGEEYGEAAPFLFFVSHGDRDLVEAVRRGRRAEFARFDWHGPMPDPADEGTFHASKLHWEDRGAGRHGVLCDYYRELLRLRKTHPALRLLSKEHLEATVLSDGQVLSLHRWSREAQALVVCHFADQTQIVDVCFPAGTWRRCLDSAETRWLGPGTGCPEVVTGADSTRLPLQPWHIVLFCDGSV